MKFLNLPTADAVKRLADGAIDFAPAANLCSSPPPRWPLHRRSVTVRKPGVTRTVRASNARNLLQLGRD